MSPGRVGGKRRGGRLSPSPTSPSPEWRAEQLEGRESIAAQPQNKGAVYWLSLKKKREDNVCNDISK